MDGFIFPGLRSRVVFGQGTLVQTASEIDRLGHNKVLILSTPAQEKEAIALSKNLGERSAGHFSGAVMHTPHHITEGALSVYHKSGATALVSLGGGSTIGLGKAIAVRTGADHIAIPTSYAGSEMTDILGETQDGQKVTRRSEDIRPEVVIYDVDLTLSLPANMTVTSAMNALAHAVEAFYASDRSPVIELMCRDAMRAMSSALPVLLEDPEDTIARSDMLYAAWCCSCALGHVSMGLHHKLAHVIGGTFNTPHAETHTILLPHVAAFNEASVPELLAPVAETFGGETAGTALWDFAARLSAPQRLRDLGLSEADLDQAADLAVANSYSNPRTFNRSTIRALLQDAWSGTRPHA